MMTQNMSTIPIPVESQAVRKKNWLIQFWRPVWLINLDLIKASVKSRSFRFVVIDEAFGRGSDESTKYALELFKKLNLQLLIVTPLQKIHIIEPFVSCVGFVQANYESQSSLRNLTLQEYQQEREAFDAAN